MSTTMREVRSHDSNILHYCAGGGLLHGVGLVVFLLGCLPVYQLLSTSGPSVGLIPALLLSAILCSFGLAVALFRKDVEIDRDGPTLTRTLRVGPFSYASDTALSGVDRMGLSTEARVTGSGRNRSKKQVYPVRFHYAAGSFYELVAPLDYSRARRYGERLAGFLQIPFEDSSSGTVVVRQPDELDLTVRERLRSAGTLPPLPTPPPSARSRVVPDGRNYRVVIPADGLRLHSAAMLLGGLLFGFFIPAVIWWPNPDFPVVHRAVTVVFLGLPMAVLVGLALFGIAARTRMWISDEVLMVKRGWGLGTFLFVGAMFPLSELEELSAPEPGTAVGGGMRAGPGLVLRSDRAALQVGRYLPSHELRYLQGVVEYMIRVA